MFYISQYIDLKLRKHIKPIIRHIILLLIASFTLLSGIPPIENDARLNPFSLVSLNAADSVMARLDDNERIAQLFVLRSNQASDLFAGGFLYSNLEELNVSATTDPNGISYLIGFDMLSGGDSFVDEQQLAETNNLDLVAKYSSAVGFLLRNNDVNFVLGPALDLYHNNLNPATEKHSFSDDPRITLSYAAATIKGLKNAGILPVVGSYPGIGSAKQGLEEESPTLFARPDQLYSNEMIPFKGLVNNGIQNIIVGNVHVPAIDSGLNYLASQSQEVNAVLKDDLGFNGLIWADISRHESDFKGDPTSAIAAGNDIIIIEDDLQAHIDHVNEAINSGILSRNLIDQKCKRIIQAKIWSLKNQPKRMDSAEVEMNLKLAQRAILESSLTLLRNKDERIPLKDLEKQSIALVHVSSMNEPFRNEWIKRYTNADVYSVRLDHLEEDYAAFQRNQDEYSLVILLAEPQSNLPRKRFGMSEHYQSVIERIGFNQPTIFAWYGITKALLFVSGIENLECVITGHEPSSLSLDFTVQKIFGGRPFNGRLKRKVGNQFEREFGLDTEKTRLAYGIPEEVGIKSEFLYPIKDIVKIAIEEKACPGAQVWFAKDGVVVVNEAIGHHRYEGRDTVKWDDLYDLASITKIAGSIAGLMKLSEDSLFSLDHNLCDYLGEWVDTTNYMNMGMRDIFSHQAGLPAFIPFYASTLQKGVPRYDIYSIAQNETYPLRVARELYIRSDQSDRMFRQILDHPIKTEKKYKYSDVGYYFALRIIEKQSGLPMDQYLNETYYRPLSLSTMGYKPLERFKKSTITPTEYDQYFRKQLVHGDVHDPGAAMLGGVGGHAGLFSNANDLGILMQMYLNGGTYGGDYFFDSTIINDFTRCQFCDNHNRRGAGFDKPLRQNGSGPSCGCTSREAFGHQGFTGTVTWADPQEEVVYVFLSNRVYPNANNRKLAQMNIRTDIQQVFYDAIEKSRGLDSTASQF